MAIYPLRRFYGKRGCVGRGRGNAVKIVFLLFLIASAFVITTYIIYNFITRIDKNAPSLVLPLFFIFFSIFALFTDLGEMVVLKPEAVSLPIKFGNRPKRYISFDEIKGYKVYKSSNRILSLWLFTFEGKTVVYSNKRTPGICEAILEILRERGIGEVSAGKRR